MSTLGTQRGRDLKIHFIAVCATGGQIPANHQVRFDVFDVVTFVNADEFAHKGPSSKRIAGAILWQQDTPLRIVLAL